MPLVNDLAALAIRLLQPYAGGAAQGELVLSAVSSQQLLGVIGGMQGFLGQFEAAWRAKNYAAEAEIAVDEALKVAGDLGVPYAGLAATLLPIAFGLVESGPQGRPAVQVQQEQEIEDRFDPTRHGRS